MASGLEHQAGADPVKIAEKVGALLKHVRAFKPRTAT
jgi:hypothetical protein